MTTGKSKFIRVSRKQIGMAIALALVIAATTIVNRSFFDGATAQQESDGTTVRISALKSESGSVRVALQQQGAGGSWGERQHPTLNTVGASAPTGVWLNSSELQLAAASVSDRPLFCVIAHGGPDDVFWNTLRSFSQLSSSHTGASVRFESSLDGAEQAAAIDRCSADGAAVIASTLADPAAVTDSLLAAKEAGARIITFNSGADYAAQAGSEMHIALDDYGTGLLAGETFNESGITGTIVCLVHEQENVGLDERCDALAASYTGGPVERLQLPETSDSADVTAFIADYMRNGGAEMVSAMMALNVNTLTSALWALDETNKSAEHPVFVATVGGGPQIRDVPLEIRQRHFLFSMNDLQQAQGYFVVSAMQFAYTFHLPSEFLLKPTIIKGVPFTYNLGSLFTEDISDVLERLDEIVGGDGSD